MVIVALLSLVLATGQEMPVPRIVSVGPVLSPEQATDVAYDAHCLLTDPSGATHNLSLEQRGGRGFRHPDHPQGSAVTTRRVVSVTEDQSSILGVGDLTLVLPFPGWAGELRGGPGDSRYVMARLGNPAPIDIRENSRLGEVKFSGTCELTRISQIPLTDAEITEYLRQ